jgi:beta-phosphoglucomutase
MQHEERNEADDDLQRGCDRHELSGPSASLNGMMRAIIFDMDGVICHSEPLHMRAFQHVLSEEELTITDQEYYDRYLAHDDRGSFEAALREHGRPIPEASKMKALLARKAHYFDDLIKQDLIIYPGVDAFIKKASERYSLALASGARRLEVEFVLKKARIRDIFAAVVSADEVKNGKPQPEAFERALILLNQVRLEGTREIQSAETLVIEDSPRCIRTAKSLGMKTVGMATSYKPEELKESDLVVDSLVGLELDSLERLFG